VLVVVAAGFAASLPPAFPVASFAVAVASAGFADVSAGFAAVSAGFAIESAPVEAGEAEEPEPIVESELDVPVLAGVVLPVLDVSAGLEVVVALSGVFVGAGSPPQATAPATRAALRTR
jgi:hypothetical protein